MRDRCCLQKRVAPAVVALFGWLAALMAAPGCGGGGGGQAGRGGSSGGLTGFGGIGGLGLADGGGPTDAGGSTGADVRLDPAPPICGNGIVETGEACDKAAAAGCATGQVCGAACACVAGSPPPGDSGTLIAGALATGRIDRFTSLLYRAYRLVGDGRLPAEFDGDFTVGEDATLFLEVSRLWATLTPAQQAQLRPYVARPTDPASVYSTPPTAALFGDSGDELQAPGDSDPIQCPAIAGVPDWRFTEGTHFVVWSCGSGDAATDPYLAKRQATAALADEVWALETPGMGPPRPDDFPYGPGDRGRIDIYLVPLNKCIRRPPGNVCAALASPKSIAAAVPDSPCDANRGPLTSSGYVLLRLDLAPNATPAAGAAVKARSDFAHEFFHILTYGLNLEAQGGACAATRYTGVGGKTSWLTEASATWAEWAYTPRDNPEYRDAQFDDYQKRSPADDSLLDNQVGADGNPAYQAFVYPLFLSQEAGGRAPFEAFWKGATGPRTPEGLDDYLDSRFSFDPHFRDFAVKMLNMTLPGAPLGPLLSAFDAAVPADFPPLSIGESLMLPPLVTDLPFHLTLAPLAAQYQQITVPDTTRWVDIDLDGAGAGLTLDAIVNVKGTWSRRRVEGQRLIFCRDDAADDISELYLVIANTGHRAGAKVDGDYKVKARVACPGSLTGWIRSEALVTSHEELTGETADLYDRLSETWTLGMDSMFTGGPLPLPAVDANWSATFEHHESVVTPLQGGRCQGQTVLQQTDGTGGGSHVGQLIIMEAPGNVIYLSATGESLGMFNAPKTSTSQTCDGMMASSTNDNIITERLTVAAIYTVLMPDAAAPGRYRGSVVVAHQETPLMGGSELVDWVVSWDIARHRR